MEVAVVVLQVVVWTTAMDSFDDIDNIQQPTPGMGIFQDTPGKEFFFLKKERQGVESWFYLLIIDGGKGQRS